MARSCTARRINSPLKSPGGKHYLATRLVELAPPHVHRVETHCRSMAFTLAASPVGVSEVVNDIDGDLTTFWNALASPETFERMRRILEATPFSEIVFKEAAARLERLYQPTSLDAIAERAAAFFIVCRQSLAGRMDSFAPLSRNRTRRQMNEQASAWLTAIEGLPLVHERLKRVVVLNRDAVEVIRQQDGPKVLFYADPPYLHETRTTIGEYRHEMSSAQHAELLDTLACIKGKFMLSGYRSAMYDAAAAKHSWNRKDIEIVNHASGAKHKPTMTECVWMNY